MPTVSTALSASITRPGPMGSPAARKVRAKNMRFSRRRPGIALNPLLRRQLVLDLLQQVGRLAAADAGDVVLIFEQHPQGIVDRLRIEGDLVELDQRLRPIDGL